MESYDLVVIGSGPGGEKAANTASFLKKRVAIIEKLQQVGGAGINTGTVPSKTLRETALALSGIRARRLQAVDLTLRREATIDDLMYHERKVSENERTRVENAFERFGVTRYTGTASFVDPHTIRITESGGSERLLKSGAFVIATGSYPFHPPEFQFEHESVHDSDEILEIKEIPRSLAVVGAGVIGAEYACTFNAIGTTVHVIDGRTALLPFLESDISAALRSSMETNGVIFHFGEKVESCTPLENTEVTLTLTSGKKLTVSDVLVCAGRTGNTAKLNLEAAGITPTERGNLTVDAHYRTSVPHIYAVGDVIGAPALASTSMEQARVAMCHFCGLGLLDSLPSILPIGIYTIPEAAMAGATEEELKKKGIEYIIGQADYGQTARGKILGETNGFLKLLFDKRTMQPLGVHVIGEQATELVHIGLFALLAPNGFNLLKDACYNYPTLAELYRHAMLDAIIKSRAAAEGQNSAL